MLSATSAFRVTAVGSHGVVVLDPLVPLYRRCCCGKQSVSQSQCGAGPPRAAVCYCCWLTAQDAQTVPKKCHRAG